MEVDTNNVLFLSTSIRDHLTGMCGRLRSGRPHYLTLPMCILDHDLRNQTVQIQVFGPEEQYIDAHVQHSDSVDGIQLHVIDGIGRAGTDTGIIFTVIPSMGNINVRTDHREQRDRINNDIEFCEDIVDPDTISECERACVEAIDPVTQRTIGERAQLRLRIHGHVRCYDIQSLKGIIRHTPPGYPVRDPLTRAVFSRYQVRRIMHKIREYDDDE
jgi:hypothetical protein